MKGFHKIIFSNIALEKYNIILCSLYIYIKYYLFVKNNHLKVIAYAALRVEMNANYSDSLNLYSVCKKTSYD